MDRDYVRRHLADQAREKELLGTETNPYNSGRWVNYSFAILIIWIYRELFTLTLIIADTYGLGMWLLPKILQRDKYRAMGGGVGSAEFGSQWHSQSHDAVCACIR